MNEQKPEPFNKNTGAELDLINIWHTIQGEGPYSGSPAIFIRLAGCNIQCPGCDTEYTKGRRLVAIRDIQRAVRDLAIRHPRTGIAVVTGGEPFRQNIDLLVGMLREMRLHVQIESNGILSPSENVIQDIINNDVTYVVSPKTSRVCSDTIHAHAFKYVINAEDVSDKDGLPITALGHKATPCVARPLRGFDGDIYLSPMNEHDETKNFQNLMAARDSALRHGYIVGVQLHILLNLP